MSDHEEAQRIRIAISYAKYWADVGDDRMRQWADKEVLDAAGKYADYLESQAYHGLVPEEDDDE